MSHARTACPRRGLMGRRERVRKEECIEARKHRDNITRDSNEILQQKKKYYVTKSNEILQHQKKYYCNKEDWFPFIFFCVLCLLFLISFFIVSIKNSYHIHVTPTR